MQFFKEMTSDGLKAMCETMRVRCNIQEKQAGGYLNRVMLPLREQIKNSCGEIVVPVYDLFFLQ